MFKNTLTGLSKKEREVFDAVCAHLNGCMRRMGLTQLDGEEDQILLDLWLDMYPYKVDAEGNPIYRTVREKVVEVVPIYEKQLKNVKDKETNTYVQKWVDVVVGGRKVERIVEKRIRELDFTNSLVEKTSIGIYKWRAEQLFINKCKYLFGDRRTRKMVEGKAVTEEVTDAWGNKRMRAVFEEEIDPKKVPKRDLMMKVNESDLSKDGDDPIMISEIAGGVEGGYEEAMLFYDLSRICNETEMMAVHKFMNGDSTNQIYKDFDKDGVKFSARAMAKLKEKLAQYLRPELVGSNV